MMGLSAWEHWIERTFIFFPSRRLECTPQHQGLKFQECFFNNTDGLQLHGWYVPAAASAPVLMWCHGNAGNISHRVEYLARVHQVGLGVFVFDYRGYGLSQGCPSEAGVYQDAGAAFQHLCGPLGVSPSQMVLLGHSLGSAVATELATKVFVRALILQSAFTNIADMARHHYPWLPGKRLVAHKFDLARRLPALKLPKLFIHGQKDKIVPFWMGEQLYRLAPPPKEFYPIVEAGHHDIYQLGGRNYFDRLKSFVEFSL
ncbi:MAG: alpha/beta hydrolase [Desulfobacca sp.]|nr:alpha/beta hydrolase [Desulfobacca sp.]